MTPGPDVVRSRGTSSGVGAGISLGMTVLFGVVGCGLTSSPEPPGAGWERGEVPDMRGNRLLILPVQLVGGAGEHLDRELTFALQQAGSAMEVLGGDELEDLLSGVGRLGADPRNLPVAAFEAGEVRRVGDPLFGSLYRMAVLTDARFILLPVSARQSPGEETDVHSLILNVALLEPRTGRVVWQGIVEGEPGTAGSPAAAASVAERVAARLLR